MSLDFGPQRALAHVLAQRAFELSHRRPHAPFVEFYTLDCILLAAIPVALGETTDRPPRHFPKAGVVAQEGFDHQLCAAHPVQRRFESVGNLAVTGRRARRAHDGRTDGGFRVIDTHTCGSGRSAGLRPSGTAAPRYCRTVRWSRTSRQRWFA